MDNEFAFAAKNANTPSSTQATSDDIAWPCKHCTGRGVMKLHESGAALAGDRGVLVPNMQDLIETHIQASDGRDRVGGSSPAYPSGKSWDEASGKTGPGKKFYHEVVSGADFTAQPPLRQTSHRFNRTRLVC